MPSSNERQLLRVGVPRGLMTIPPTTGHGKAWHHMLRELASRVDLVPLALADRRHPSIDVWLTDGHRPAPRTRVPLVAVVHEAGGGDPELDPLFEADFLRLLDEQTRATCARAAAIITPSDVSRRQIIGRYSIDPSSVHVVRWGVDSTVFRPLPTPSPGPRPYVLFASTAHPRKNLSVLRDAVDDLIVDGHDLRLVLVASAPPDRADAVALLDAAAAPLPRSGSPVVNAAPVTEEELAALMSGSEAFVLPSLWEGFGLTALEAMACGAPVVASDRGALREVVGDAALVVPPTREGIREALRAVVTDGALRTRLRDAGLERAGEFTWAGTAAHAEAILERAAAEGRSGVAQARALIAGGRPLFKSRRKRRDSANAATEN